MSLESLSTHGEPLSLNIVLILTIGFAFASILGYLTYRAKLSPILGYLFAGYLIGPYSPGFVANLALAEQLAEIGVILMMFGVGLQFKWEELISVKSIAVPGAIGQVLVAALVSTALIYNIGWTLKAGIIFGLAIGVASTVVLVRVLADNGILNTPRGHIAVGWLIVEDLITIIILILVPALAHTSPEEAASTQSVLWAIFMALFKFFILALLMFTIGHKVVVYLMTKIVDTNSHELFTLTILALTFVIALGSSYLFGTSIALGAFIAGMLIGQTHVRRQVSLKSMPLKDTFSVIFFLSIGMLFNPSAITEHFLLFISILGIVLIIKPLAAILIVFTLKHPFKTALTVAIALAQIGEFSFILAEEAVKFDIFPDIGYDIIVATSLVSISLNPLLFKFLKMKKIV